MISYQAAPVPVRDDIRRAHEATWQHIASPGSWWTGAERVAIAAEARAARSCAFCAERKQALSPYMLEGEHHHASDTLGAVAIDAVHRIVTDPARLSRRFYDDVISAEGLSDAHYVELLGVVLSSIVVDAFCRAVGVPPHPLPDPEPGEPDRQRPAATQRIGAWVPTIDYARLPDDSDRRLAELERAPHVLQALTLVPSEVLVRFALASAHYVPGPRTVDPGFDPGRAISRTQMELVAARVSSLQECFY